MFKRILSSALRIAIAVAAFFALLWWFGVRMPGKNISKAAPLSPDDVKLREELRADVHKLAGDIGERNMWHYTKLNAAADFIEDSFSRAGLHPRRDSYEIRGQACHNIEVEIPGEPQGAAVSSPPSIILIGAHYDSVFGSPGANDNGSGVAAMLALARRFAGKTTQHTLRFVAFVNEEPPPLKLRRPRRRSLVRRRSSSPARTMIQCLAPRAPTITAAVSLQCSH